MSGGAGGLERRLERYRPLVGAEMRAVVGGDPSPLFAWMRHHLGWEDGEGRAAGGGPGKMLRPAALLLAAEACGGDAARALPAAAAVELVHGFSLLHDDIEDGSELRRGRPALWTFAGVAQAINTGDGMFALARLAMHRLPAAGAPPAAALAAMEELDRACLRLVEGQHLDIAFESRPRVGREEYLAMIEGKTAALFAASAGIGALLAGAPRERAEALREWGRQTGLAFQAADDLLGVRGDPAATGKPAGDDLAARKQTWPVIAALASGRAPRLEAAYAEAGGEGAAAPPDAEALAAEIEAAGGLAATEALARERLAAARAALGAAGLGPDARKAFEQFAALAAQREA